MGYYFNQRTASGEPDRLPEDGLTPDRWGDMLEHGSSSEKRVALRRLVAASAEDVLVRCLAVADPAVVRLAVAGLWECWHDEAGPAARQELEIGVDAMNEGNLAQAAETFTDLAERFPDWAEAINKMATVFYLQNRPQASLELCRQVVALKPDHFGAWNGLTLCAVQVEDWTLALRGVRESLRLQPHSPANRQLLHLVESRLPPS